MGGGVSPHHISGEGYPGSGHAPFLEFITTLALWALIPGMEERYSLWLSARHLLGLTANPSSYFGCHSPSLCLPTPGCHRGRQQPHCANLTSFIQIIFLKRTFVCRNPSQTTSRIEPSKVINHEFRETDEISPDIVSMYVSQQIKKNNFPFEGKKTQLWP